MVKKLSASRFIFYSSIFIFIIIILIFSNKDVINNDYFQKADKLYYGAYLEKERTFKNMLDQYNNSLKALHSNKLFNNFVLKGENKKDVLDLFLHIKKSFMDITQIRYLDNMGNEILRVDGSAISVFRADAKSIIVEDEKLQNKGNKEYFKKFIKSEPLTIKYSKINLNKEHGEVTIPKEPTIRMGITVYGNGTQAKGVLIYNISLRSFFQDMFNHFLYDFIIVDSKGDYIFHHDLKYGLLGNEPYTLKDEFSEFYNEILKSNEYKARNLHSYTLKSLNKVENIKLIVREKLKN